MPFLGDYLGQLLSELSIARMQADLESVRLAELYAAHPLLKTMPVPHVRLPDVDLDVPVAVTGTAAQHVDEPPRGGVPVSKARERIGSELSDFVGKAGLDLSPAERVELDAALDARVNARDNVGADATELADDLAGTVLTGLQAIRQRRGLPAASGEQERAFRDSVRAQFVKLRTPPPRVSVAVTTAELREAGPAENITRLRLKISEQALELVSVDAGGTRSERFIPE